MSERGQDLVEYALVLPVLMLLLVGVMEFAVVIFTYNTITDAAREGARYGVIHPLDHTGIDMAARRLTTGLSQADLSVYSSLPGGNVIRVEVTYSAHLITNLLMDALGASNLQLRAVATMQIE